MRCVKVFATVALRFEKIFILLQCCVMWQTVMNLRAKAYSDEITLIGVCRDVTLVKVMAWCRQAIRHYLHPCCPYRMIPCGVITDHYNDVIMSAMASQITSLRIVYSIVYSGANKKNFKASRHWPLCREFTGDRWIPCTNGQWRGKCFHLMTSSCWSINLYRITI